MQSLILEDAVERYAQVALGMMGSDLEKPWAWQDYDSEGIRFAFFRTYEELRELAVRLAAERANSGPAITAAQRILGQYHLAFRDLQAVLLGLSDSEAERPPAEGEWPVHVAIGHIVGAEALFHLIAGYALGGKRSGDGRPAEIPEAYYLAQLGSEEEFRAAESRPLSALRTWHATLHAQVLGELYDISDEELEAPSRYWEAYDLPIRFRLHRFDSHMRQHTIQIEKTLAALYGPPDEIRRLLRLIYAALAEAEAATLGAGRLGAAAVQATAEAISARAGEIGSLI
jgi:hypothetical protein